MPAYFFYGEDDFSLRRKLEIWKTEFARKYSADAIAALSRGDGGEAEMVSRLEQALSPSLFSSKKLVLARDFLPAKAAETRLGEFLLAKLPSLPDDYYLVLWQTGKPDRRLGLVKKILSLPGLAATDFSLPHGRELNGWIKAFAKTLGLEVDDAAADELARFVGRDFYEEKRAGGRVVDRKEAFDLWQVHSELRKLAAYGRADLAAVRALVRPKVPENVFALSDELAKKNLKGAAQTLEHLLAQPGADEKSAAIKIVGLLAEQVRGMLLVKALQEEGKSAGEMADALGWSSGRVFMVTRNAAGQSAGKLAELLSALAEIDIRLKSSEDNPKLLLNQFLMKACA